MPKTVYCSRSFNRLKQFSLIVSSAALSEIDIIDRHTLRDSRTSCSCWPSFSSPPATLTFSVSDTSRRSQDPAAHRTPNGHSINPSIRYPFARAVRIAAASRTGRLLFFQITTIDGKVAVPTVPSGPTNFNRPLINRNSAFL